MLLSSARTYQKLEIARDELERLEQNNFDADEVAKVQASKLSQLWDRAASVPYYERLIDLEAPDLESLPPTPKSLLKSQPELFSLNNGQAPLKYYETSGTSGVPTPTPRYAEDIIKNVVSVAGCWKRVLADNDRVAMLLPSDLSPIGDLISNVCEYLEVSLVRCYPFAVGICDWDRVEQMFTRYRPTCLFAAPGVTIQFMRLLKRRGSLAEAKQSVEKIMLLGEVSTSGLRKMLSDNWEAKVYDASYGGTETGTVAATCERQRLHTLTHSFLLEVSGPAGIKPLAPGQQGELIVTTLNNYARPLLRYASGDVVEVSDGSSCDCGLNLPLLRVLGRKDEAILANGSRLDAETVENIVYETPGITDYMIELDDSSGYARLLVEKDVDISTGLEARVAKLEKDFLESGITWDAIVPLNELPPITKSGAGQKNWKTTNVRMVSQNA